MDIYGKKKNTKENMTWMYYVFCRAYFFARTRTLYAHDIYKEKHGEGGKIN